METLLHYLQSIYPLPDALVGQLSEVLQHRTVHRRELLLRAGHTCRHIFFVRRGLFRCFYLRVDSEVCAWFMKENDVMVSVESFFYQRPSYESIQALEEGELYYVDYETLQGLYQRFPEFNFVARVLTEKYYALSEQRLYSLRMQRAPERYKHLVDHHADLVQRVPSKYLASYLGITEETLSRIKSRKLIY